MSEIIKLSPKVLELNSQSNDIYMVLKMVILTTKVNLNNAQFEESFIDSVVNNNDFYNGIALVVNRVKLENEVYDSLNHEYDNGELKTDMIGSFVKFEKVLNEDGSYSLVGESRIQKRFSKVCEAVIELYNSGQLSFSCEVLVKSYSSIENGVRKIGDAEGNVLYGNCIVSSPAEISAKPTLLVASLDEDLKQNKSEQTDLDINSTEGGQAMDEVFNKGFQIKFVGQIENCELSFDDISQQIYNSLNPEKEDGYREYNYWIKETFPSYVIVEDWNNSEALYQINYTVAEDVVSVDSKENWIQVEQVYVPKGQTVVNEEELKKSQEELASKIEELSNLQAEITQLKEVKTEVEIKDETLIKLNEQVVKLQEEISSFAPIKEEHERLQEEKRIAELNAKKDILKQVALNSKQITSEEIESNEEIKQAIEELNEQFIEKLIIKRICEANSKINTEEPKKDGDVVIATAQPSDLLPETIESKFGLNF